MSGKMILLVEDDKDVRQNIKRMLADEGFAVETAAYLAEARAVLAQRQPDAAILDIGLPDGNGLDFLREFRETSRTPVLLLTGFGEDDDILRGFKSGCDDYLSKPYTFAVLLARLKRLLQNAEQVPETITKGALKLNIPGAAGYVNGEDMLLTQKEFSLLVLFTQHEGQALGAETLYEKVWGQPLNNDNNAIKNQVSNLRKKLEGSGHTIRSLRGQGYCFEERKLKGEG